jgi:hypothetical protein
MKIIRLHETWLAMQRLGETNLLVPHSSAFGMTTFYLGNRLGGGCGVENCSSVSRGNAMRLQTYPVRLDCVMRIAPIDQDLGLLER